MIQSFTFNPFSENTYLVADASGQAAIIDPGCSSDREWMELLQFIEQGGLQPVLLLNTHCHIDHVLGNHYVFEHFGLAPWIHPADEQDLKRLVSYAPMFGMEATASPEPAGYLEAGQALRVGQLTLQLLEAPGHSAGSICFYNEKEQYVVSGDVLFAGSIGRTDLPGGDYDTLLASVRNTLFTLPAEVTVYPGHGPATTIGHEQRTNPFFQ